MEALAAISLAGNVLQFVTFGTTVVKRGLEYHDSRTGKLRKYEELASNLDDLEKLLTRLERPALPKGRSNAVESLPLQRQVQECRAIGGEIRKALLNVKAKSNNFWTSTGKAFLSILTEPVLAELRERLASVQLRMQLEISVEQKDQLRHIHESQAEIFLMLDAVSQKIFENAMEGSKDPLKVSQDVITQQLERLHNETQQMFTARFDSMTAELEKINERLNTLSVQTSSSSPEATGINLWNAIRDGDFALVQLLLDRSVDVNFTNENSNSDSCLHLAARHGSVKILELLLQQNPNLDIYSDAGITPLMSASMSGATNTVTQLLDAGCNLEASMRATRGAVFERIDINNEKTEGSTALTFATRYGHTNLVRQFLARGARVDVATNHGFTPLVVAAVEGFAQITTILLDQGADIEAKTDQGFTPLLYAVHRGHRDIVTLLLDRGANIEAKKSHGLNPLFEALWTSRVDMIKLLLARGARVDVRVPGIADQSSLLHWAISQGDVEVVRMILERRPEMGSWCRDGDPETPVQLARRKGDPDMLDLVLSYSGSEP